MRRRGASTTSPAKRKGSGSRSSPRKIASPSCEGNAPTRTAFFAFHLSRIAAVVALASGREPAMMRDVRVRFPLVAFVVVSACADVTAPPRIFVSKVPSGMHSAREDGDVLKLTRWELDPRAGLTRGYWVVK